VKLRFRANLLYGGTTALPTPTLSLPPLLIGRRRRYDITPDNLLLDLKEACLVLRLYVLHICGGFLSVGWRLEYLASSVISQHKPSITNEQIK